MPGSATRVRSSARSLADDVRGRSDDQLRALIRARPDLARPAPADLTSLAARASTRASVQRALDSLDRAHLQVLEAVLASGDPVDLAETASLLGESARTVARYLNRLWDMALLWRGQNGEHVVRTVTDVLGSRPAGLGPSVVELRGSLPACYRSPQTLDAVIAAAPAQARAILDRLAWGPAIGQLAADGALATAGTWLLTHQLLCVHSADHVVLPREVALRLRGGRLHRAPALTAPALTVTPHDPPSVNSAAGGQAAALLGLVDELAATWGPRPPRVLRAGGLAVRDLRTLAAGLDLDLAQAAFVAEIAYAAGLLADDGSLEPVWAPTPAYDEWQQQPSAARWVRLACAWLVSGRAHHLVGSPAPKGSGTINALSADVLWPPTRQLRRDVLHELAALPAGQAADLPSLTDRIRWRRPLRRAEVVQDVVAAVTREAEWLGVTGRGALSAAGRAFVGGGPDPTGAAVAAEQAIGAHLPSPVEHVVLQGDLTAIAPGPLEGSLAQFMRLVADVESRGGATVYRFSAVGLRRCLDSGWSAAQILTALQDASRTPVPQPLQYLVGDVARRHGQTRVGSVGAYIRSDDELVLDSMLVERGLGALQLRRVAPTVLVSPAQPPVVLGLLRDNGFAPVAETVDGGVLVPAATQHRTPARRPPATPRASVVDDEVTETLVAALRAGEEATSYSRAREASLPGPRLPSTDPAVTLSLLRDGTADRHGVWIGHADADGMATRMLFFPTRIEGGRAYGTVEGSNVERSFSIHRITGAAPA